MSNTYFRFKQFSINQDATAMKVNTDGVLLGAWAAIHKAERMLDVGTGTGIIALMLAQRNAKVRIDAVEMDELAVKQALANIQKSPWHHRMRVFHDDFLRFSKHHAGAYDAVIANPPYFVNALLPPETSRTLARHAGELPPARFIDSVVEVLTPSGELHVVLPKAEGTAFIAEAACRGLYCVRKTNVRPVADKAVKRLLLTFSRIADETLHEDTLCIHESDSADYTAEYKALTRDFYLKF